MSPIRKGNNKRKSKSDSRKPQVKRSTDKGLESKDSNIGSKSNKVSSSKGNKLSDGPKAEKAKSENSRRNNTNKKRMPNNNNNKGEATKPDIKPDTKS